MLKNETIGEKRCCQNVSVIISDLFFLLDKLVYGTVQCVYYLSVLYEI